MEPSARWWAAPCVPAEDWGLCGTPSVLTHALGSVSSILAHPQALSGDLKSWQRSDLAGSLSLRLISWDTKQDRLHNWEDSTRNENAEPLVQNLVRIPRWQQLSINREQALCDCTGHSSMESPGISLLVSYQVCSAVKRGQVSLFLTLKMWLQKERQLKQSQDYCQANIIYHPTPKDQIPYHRVMIMATLFQSMSVSKWKGHRDKENLTTIKSASFFPLEWPGIDFTHP